MNLTQERTERAKGFILSMKKLNSEQHKCTKVK